MFPILQQIASVLGAQNGAPAPSGGCVGDQNAFFLPVIMMLILYFVWILPARKEKKTHQAMVDALKRGDEVVTTSGILGTISDLSDRIVTLQIDRNVKIRMLKSAIARRPDAAKEKDKEERTEKAGEEESRSDSKSKPSKTSS